MLFGLVQDSHGQTVKNNELADKLTYQVIPSENNTWGYDVYRNNKLFVHQLAIPGVAGTAGFKTKTAAEAVAKLVIEKIKKGEIPPGVTREELKKLKVI